MAIGFSSPEDVVNAALREARYPRPIAEIYEGSRAAKVALEVYGAARDFLLHQKDWDFALREANLTPTVGGKLILGFTHEYDYPSDALRIRYVHGPIPTPNHDPQPMRFITGNDETLSSQPKVIFTNQAAAIAGYAAQIIDPLTWNAGFTRAFVGLLSEIFAFALSEDINLSRARAQVSDQTTMEAASVGDYTPPVPLELMARALAAGRQQ